MIACVTATVQFFHSNQDHVVRNKFGPGFSRPKVDAVEAAPADIREGLIAVCFCVPCVSAVFLFAQLFPHVTHTLRQTSNLYHLHRQVTFFSYATSRLLLSLHTWLPGIMFWILKNLIYLAVSEIGVSAKKDSDIIWCLPYLLKHNPQLFHSLLWLVLTAFQVWCHQV